MNRCCRFLALVWLLAVPVAAHRLTVDWAVAGGTLTLQARTDNAPAAGADVELRSTAGAVLTSGQMDEAGRFSWTLANTNDLTVAVNAGLGHRRTLTLTSAELRGAATAANVPPAAPAAPDSPVTALPQAAGGSDGASPLGTRVVLGLAFLLAAAAAWMSYRNARRLEALERALQRLESRG
jgi:hypothetical protein